MVEKQFSERDLIQLLQQEQNNLASKEALVEKITALLRETMMAKEILSEMQTNKTGKMQVSIGASILVEVEAKALTKCKRAFAEGGYIEEPVEDVKKWLSEREENFKKEFEKANAEYTATHNRVTELVGILKQIDAEKKKQANKQPLTISR